MLATFLITAAALFIAAATGVLLDAPSGRPPPPAPGPTDDPPGVGPWHPTLLRFGGRK